MIHPCGDHRLAAVGEDFHQILVDEHAQFQVLASGQVGHGKRGFGAAQAKGSSFRLEQYGQAFKLLAAQQEAEPLPFRFFTADDDSNLQ